MTEQPTIARIALRWGLLTALVEIAVTSIRYALGQYVNFFFPFLTVVILVTGSILAMREFKQVNNGWMKYTEGISICLIMFAIIGILDTTYQQIYQTYINPSYTEVILDQSRSMMERFGASEQQLEQFDEQAENAASASSKGQAGLAFIGSVLWWIFSGLLISLVVSAFMRKVKDNPFD